MIASMAVYDESSIYYRDINPTASDISMIAVTATIRGSSVSSIYHIPPITTAAIPIAIMPPKNIQSTISVMLYYPAIL